MSQHQSTYYNPPEDIKVDKRQEPIKQQQHKSSFADNRKADFRKLYKIEHEEENFHHKRIDGDISKKIIQKRVEMKLSRKDLAQKINIKEKILSEYESGKAIPDNNIMNKIRNILKI